MFLFRSLVSIVAMREQTGLKTLMGGLLKERVDRAGKIGFARRRDDREAALDDLVGRSILGVYTVKVQFLPHEANRILSGDT